MAIFIVWNLTSLIYILFQDFIKYKIRGNGFSLAIIIAMSPIVIHNQVQYPFLLSVTHWGIVILFLSFSDTAFLLNEQVIFNINNSISNIIGLFILLVGISIFLWRLLFFNGEGYFYAKGNESDPSKKITLISFQQHQPITNMCV